jgi:hypothetical protein
MVDAGGAGFIAGWGIDAFSVIIYTTLAPAMPSAATGWLPGFVFGLGTLCVQAAPARHSAPGRYARPAAGGDPAHRADDRGADIDLGRAGFRTVRPVRPGIPRHRDVGVRTPLRVHNLDTLGLPFLLLVFAVLGVGVTSFVSATQAWRRHLIAGNAASATLKP